MKRLLRIIGFVLLAVVGVLGTIAVGVAIGVALAGLWVVGRW